MRWNVRWSTGISTSNGENEHLGPSPNYRFDPGLVRIGSPFETNRLAEEVFRAIEPLNRSMVRHLRESENLVDQTSASWNRVRRWLRVVSALARQDPDLAGTPGYQIV